MIRKFILLVLDKLLKGDNFIFVEFFLLFIFLILLFFEKLTVLHIIKLLFIVLLIRFFLVLLFFVEYYMKFFFDYFSKRNLRGFLIFFNYWSYFSNLLIFMLWNMNLRFYFFWRWVNSLNIKIEWKERVYTFIVGYLFKPILRLLYLYYSLIIRWKNKTFLELMFHRMEGLVISILLIAEFTSNFYYLEQFFFILLYLYLFSLVFFPERIKHIVKAREKFEDIDFDYVLYLRDQVVISRIAVNQIKCYLLKNSCDLDIINYVGLGKYSYFLVIINIFNKTIMFTEKKNKVSIFWYNYIVRLFNELNSNCEIFFKLIYLLKLTKNNRLNVKFIISDEEKKNVEIFFKRNFYILKKFLIFFKSFSGYYNFKFNDLFFGKQDYSQFFFFCFKLDNSIDINDKILNEFNKEFIFNNINSYMSFEDIYINYKELFELRNFINCLKEQNEYKNIENVVNSLERFCLENKICLELTYDSNYIKFVNKFYFKLVNLWIKDK